MRYLRFVVRQKDRDSGVRQGLFQTAIALKRNGTLSMSEASRLHDLGRWFDEHLPRPKRFTRTKNASHKRTRGIAWFKDVAHEHLRRAREMISILETQGVVVEVIETQRPGYVVYEDEFQIVAEPFADTGA